MLDEVAVERTLSLERKRKPKPIDLLVKRKDTLGPVGKHRPTGGMQKPQTASDLATPHRPVMVVVSPLLYIEPNTKCCTGRACVRACVSARSKASMTLAGHDKLAVSVCKGAAWRCDRPMNPSMGSDHPRRKDCSWAWRSGFGLAA